MARIKYWLSFRRLLFTSLLVISATSLSAQTPDVKPKPSGSISGRVTIGEKPAPGILIMVNGMNSAMPAAQATSDADGNYRLAGLPAGQISVTPVAPVYVLPVNPMYGQGRVINLSTNENVEGIDFKLIRGGVITGRVTDADGRPVIDERVTLLSVDENGAQVRGMSFRGLNVMMYQTDDRGIYRLYGLPAGHYKVSAGSDPGGGTMRTSGYYQKVYYPDATDIAKAAIVDVSEGGETKNIDIKLARLANTYSVSGRVIDADSGQPLPGVYFAIGVVQQNQNQSYVSGTSGPGTPTNSQGEFRMEGLSPGRYAILLNATNYIPNSAPAPKVYTEPVPFEVLDGDVTNLEVKAKSALSISGVVVLDGVDKTMAAKISNVMLYARVEPAQGGINVFSGGVSANLNPDGSFVLDGLSPGRVTVNLGYRGPDFLSFRVSRMEGEGVSQNHQINLAPGQNLSGLKIYLTYGSGVIRGQLKVEGGTLASDAIVFIQVMRPGESSPYSGQVDSRGRFLIKDIAPGTYEVTMQLISLGPQTAFPRGVPRQQRQTVTVTNGTETEVVFTLDLTPKDVP
ncbi:MAG TPA: carboxypeptidase regulatory-like domain-containing protein [Pyrinomonadaceae bacterium]|nr:carboxypeptidase regulatory-like domain-containing protein [Pyrinomonadaceae bacterium]